MKQLLNTLFVMTEDAYLALENDNVVIYQNDQTLAKVPLRSIEGILRRAWIEMTCKRSCWNWRKVALLTESVD